MTQWLSGWSYRKPHEIIGSTAGAVTDYQIRIKVHYGCGIDSDEDVYLGVYNVESGSWTVDGNSYKYRLKVKVTEKSGQDLTDYQVKVTINTAWLVSKGYATSSGNEVRFTDDQGSLLSFWRENDFNQEETIYWVKVPSIPANSTVDIYMYFDPDLTGVPDASDPDSTFDFFDDFDGSSLDTNKWDMHEWTAGSHYYEVVNSELHVYAYSPNDPSGYAFSTKEPIIDLVNHPGYRIEVKSRWANLDYVRGGGDVVGVRVMDAPFGTSVSDGRGLAVNLYGDYYVVIRRYSWTSGSYSTTYSNVSDKTSGTAQWVIIVTRSSVNFSLSGTYSHSWTPSALPQKAYYLRLYVIVDYWTNPVKTDSYFDLVLVRKYVDPEPEAKPETIEKCRSDFGDIRFTADDGVTELPYWMEEKVDGDYAVFWVKVPSIPASPDTATIYIYYGNPSATTTSNGEATFILFDDFETDTTDNYAWVNPYAYAGWSIGSYSYDSVNKRVSITTGDNIAIGAKLGLNLENLAVSADFLATTYYPNGDVLAISVRYTDPNNQYQGRVSSQYDAIIHKVVAGTGTTIASVARHFALNTKHRVELRIYGTHIELWVDDSLILSAEDSDITGAGDAVICMGQADGWMDNFRIRKYIYPEPTHGAWGSEEVPPVAYEITLTESLGLADTCFKTWIAHKTYSELLGLADSIRKELGKVFPEVLGLSDVVVKSPSITRLEILRLKDVYSRTWNVYLVHMELLGLADSISKSASIPLAEALGLFDSLLKSSALTKTELLGLKDFMVKETYKTFTENLGLLDTISTVQTLIRVLTEELELKATFSRVWIAQRTYTEALSLRDYVSKGVSLHALAEVLGLLDSIRYGKNLTVLAKLIRKLIQLEEIGGDWLE